MVALTPLHVGGHEVDQAVDSGGRTAFEWDDDGQGGLLRTEGRASIETLWWRGKDADANVQRGGYRQSEELDLSTPATVREAN